MTGILDYFNKISYKPTPTSMGLLQMGAQMLANSGPSYTPQGFGTALGNGLMGFAQGAGSMLDRQREQEDRDFRTKQFNRLLANDDLDRQYKTLQMDKLKNPSQYADPYHTTVETSQGIFDFNNRTGGIVPLMNGDKPLMRSASDPYQQGLITRFKESEKGVKVTDENNRTYYTTQADANPSAFAGLPALPPVVTARPRQMPKENPDLPPVFVGDPATLSLEERAFLENKHVQMPRGPIMSPSMDEIAEADARAAGLKKEAEKQAAAKSEAEIALPGIENRADYAIELLTGLKDHKGLSDVVGMPDILSLRGRVPGTPGANFNARLNQIKGGQFLEAIQMLRGTGQITEIEGKKATDAIARLDPNMSEEEFIQAIDEAIAQTKKGIELERTKAGHGRAAKINTQAPSSDAATSRESIDDIVNRYLK